MARLGTSSNVNAQTADHLPERGSPDNFFSSTEIPHKQTLTFATKLFYGFGDAGNGFVVSSISVWYLFFLTDSLALSPAIAGLAVIFARVTNACGDLLAGWLSDRTQTRWGKKRPFLAFGCIPYAILFISAWAPFNTASATGVVSLLAVLLFFNISFSLVFVPYASLTATITENYSERTSLTAFRIAFSQSAMLLGATLPGVFLAASRIKNGETSLSSLLLTLSKLLNCSVPQTAFLACATIGGTLIILSNITTFMGTKERSRISQTDSAVTANSPFQGSQLGMLVSELRTNSAYRTLVSMIVLNNCALTIIAASLPYAISYLIGNEDLQTKLVGAVFITAVISIPFWNYLAHTIGKRNAYSRATLIYSAVLISLPLVFTTYPALSFPAVILAGFFYGAALMLPWAMVPDVIEHSHARSKAELRSKMQDGLYYSGTTFCYKATSGISAAILAMSLSVSGYAPHVAQNTTTLIIICCGIGPVPALFLAIASRISKSFPVDAETHLRSLEKLQKP